MKKLILLALVALVAGAAFAESAPAFSGTFDFFTTWDFENETMVKGSNQDASINLNGVVDEWSTVNAEFGVVNVKSTEVILSYVDNDTSGTITEGDDVTTTFDTYEDIVESSDFIGMVPGDALSGNDDNVLGLNEFTMTTNITGALGMDGPVGLSLTWGKTSLQPAEYQGVAGYQDAELTNPTDSYLGVKLAFTIVDKVKLITAIYPGTYSDWDGVEEAVFAMDLQFVGLVEGLNFNVYYTLDPNQDNDGDTLLVEETNEVGLTAGYSMGAINSGLAFKYNMFDDTIPMGVSFSYTADFGLTAGIAFKTDFSAMDTESALGLNLTYKVVADVLDAFLAAKIPFDNLADDMGFEAGVKTYLGGVTYILGYEYQQANFASPNGDDSTGLFFTVKASF